MTKEKNKTTKLVVSIILAILVAIAGVVTGVLLFKLAILPVQLTIGAMIALIIIGVLALVLVLRRKRGWVFGIVLSVIYLLCCGVGSYYLYHTNQAVDEILILFLCPFLGSMAAFPIFFHPRIPPPTLLFPEIVTVYLPYSPATPRGVPHRSRETIPP